MIQLESTINPRKCALVLGIIAVYLALQSLISEYWLENVLSSEIDGIMISLLDLFSVNLEASIPTWYATILLFVSAVLLALITAVKLKQKDPYARYWLGLSIVFLYLSVDEGAAIHEIFSDPLQAALHTTGYLNFAWLIVFVPLVLLFALLYLRFLFHLPARIRNLVILAGVLYVGGAVIVEAISANRWYVDGGVSFPYLAIATVEELCEMLGVVVFIFALLSYLSEGQYTAVTHFSALAQTAQPRKWAMSLGIAAIVAVNVILGSWVYRQQSASAAQNGSSTPFYQEIAERYAGQGVVILQINEVITPDNPAASQYAVSLLTLFDDILIVTLPQQQLSIVFAGQSLPFDRNILIDILQNDGEMQFAVLDNAALSAMQDSK